MKSAQRPARGREAACWGLGRSTLRARRGCGSAVNPLAQVPRYSPRGQAHGTSGGSLFRALRDQHACLTVEPRCIVVGGLEPETVRGSETCDQLGRGFRGARAAEPQRLPGGTRLEPLDLSAELRERRTPQVGMARGPDEAPQRGARRLQVSWGQVRPRPAEQPGAKGGAEQRAEQLWQTTMRWLQRPGQRPAAWRLASSCKAELA